METDQQQQQQTSSSPSQNPNHHNSIFKDISNNFKTPKRNPNSNFQSPFPKYKTPKPSLQSPIPQFFTASKQTPHSSFRRRSSSIVPSSRSKTVVRKLKAFELEQSQSSRKAQIQKEKSLKSLSNAISVWLNFLFENPKACGCDVSVLRGEDGGVEDSRKNGKRDSWPGSSAEVGINGPWRSPKRQRDCTWLPQGGSDGEPLVLSSSMFSSLKVSLQEICSFDDLKLRMREYLSSESCKEVFSVMTKVTKNIDEGRLKMKVHCPIVTDVRLREQAMHVLMCYNSIWLRIGLYIVFGGDSLLPSQDVDSDQELSFLKMIVEKQLFSHADLAKKYAYNKSVVGLYRPGYFEALGNIILKRFLLLVLILDSAKTQSSLPIKYGIDGIDGGSPLLFDRQSSIKSSRQVVHDFLTSEVMHGEGDLLAHLVIVGYKVSYQQYPLLDYDFSVKDLIEDLQDGVRLCRAIQLLKCDTSIFTKVAVPSDTHKKSLVNCGIALQYLKQSGVPLSDEDGVMVIAEDIVSGEKELTLSLLWNMFVHLQLPLLVNKRLLFEEIRKVKGTDMDCLMSDHLNLLEMILQWIQDICLKYDLKVPNYAALVDGKAMWCMIDYYFRHEFHCSSSCKAHITEYGGPNFWAIDCSDAVHNFILSQKLTTMLGNIPEVLQTCDILEHKGACNELSVIILLAFLSSQLIGRKHMDQLNIHRLLGCSCPSPEVKRLSSHKCFLSSEAPVKHDGLDEYYNEDAARKFKVIQAWWRNMAKHHNKCAIRVISPLQCHTASRDGLISQRRASKTIQSHFRGLIARRKFLKIKTAVCFLQSVIRAWFKLKMTNATNICAFPISKQLSLDCQKHPYTVGRYLMFMVQRHSFVSLKKSALIIQQAARTWIAKKRNSDSKSNSEILAFADQTTDCHVKKEVRRLTIRIIVTLIIAWRRWRKSIIRKCIAATRIQTNWRAWTTRAHFLQQKKAIIRIQGAYQLLKDRRDFKKYRVANRAAIIIQSHFRGQICRNEVYKERHLILLIQTQWRGWLIRRDYLRRREAAIVIQRSLQCLKSAREFQCNRHAATEIQRYARGQLARNKLLGVSFYRSTGCTGLNSSGCIISLEFKIFLYSVMKLQRWWKRILLLKSKTRSAMTIQSYVRGWMARRKACREKYRIIVIQSYWKGYLARKELRGQLLELRLRVQRSCSNVDDGMRLINRLVCALSELLNTRSISSILHTCSTLDIATTHSERCCETIVAAGAVETLLKLISSMSRSIPDQEVLKHALSTLRNISRYPLLADVLIDTEGSTETILREMLRNKEEGYFIASNLLKNLCSTEKGVASVLKLPALLKRLHKHVNDLTKKVTEKRKTCPSAKEYNERRLREATELLKLISSG
ncbi:Abnormal spindle-like microcephaly-associated protein isogeny [Thalictrum thalictroides]|uniref:Abnormal spindle-like microcephaly-associated protein isogeny n=1 Tax=Thalictrum thalictroides TaxID=46969 RepID=A0A7J6V2N8_THATH|nr:Abnormal spindle-like microcephaly-associated protein isogeny [Thalictrum thalictroides]